MGRTTRTRIAGAITPAGVRDVPVTGRSSTDIGTLTHLVVQMLAERAGNRAALAADAFNTAHAFIEGTNTAHRRAVALEVAGYASEYLVELRPLDADLLGVELAVPGGGGLTWCGRTGRPAWWCSTR